MNRSLPFVALALAALGCQQTTGNHPSLTPESSQPSYAMRYPEDLTTNTKAATDRPGDEKELSASFVSRVADIKKTDWAKVTLLVEKADESGKSAGYADAYNETHSVRTFWNDEKDTVNSRVSGNVSYAASKGGCSADVGGAATFALKEAIDKGLEKRLRAKNDAFVILERYKTTLGQPNIAALEKLADDVALASYIVHVELPEQRDRLRTKVAEKDAVVSTLDRFVDDERAYQAEPGRTDAEKKASEERIAAATKQKQAIEASAANANAALQAMDQKIDAASKEYDDALSALKAKINEKKDEKKAG